jgi:hypothetical protein
VVADSAKRQFTFSTRKQQRERIAFLERTGYQVVFQRRGYVVLHLADGRASAGTSGRPAG